MRRPAGQAAKRPAIHTNEQRDGGAARAGVAAWIEDCNTARRHSALGMMSPVAWELAHGTGQEAA